MNQTGTNLIEKIANGNKQAFEEVFKTYYYVLCIYAKKYVANIETAEEIVQGMFVKIWEKRKTLHLNISVNSYLYTSVKNSCLDYLKHLKIKSDYESLKFHQLNNTQYTIIDELAKIELEKIIDNAIAELPEKRRKIFIMNRFENLKYREISKIMGISIKTVENQMGSALKYMRNKLKDFRPDTR